MLALPPELASATIFDVGTLTAGRRKQLCRIEKPVTLRAPKISSHDRREVSAATSCFSSSSSPEISLGYSCPNVPRR